MLRGIESATKGMLGVMELNDVIANNLANVNSAGFKETKLIFKNIHDSAVNALDKSVKGNETKQVGSLSVGSVVDAAVIDFSQGGLRITGNPLDVAINGKGFFEVQMPDGSSAYTRNGSFILTDNGGLTTINGEPVMGEGGQIQLDLKQYQTKDITISGDGVIHLDKEEVGKLRIVDFANKAGMKTIGSALFVPGDGQNSSPHSAENFQVVQGAIESSNSNIIQTMVNSIAATRMYETLSNIIQAESRTLDKTINQVARLRQ